MGEDVAATTTIERLAVEPERKRLTIFERVKLAERLAAARGLPPDSRPTWDKLAEQEGMSERGLRYIYAEWLDAQETMDDPFGVVEETLHLYSEAIAKFAEEADKGDNSAARVGATRSMLEAAKGRLELLAATGKLPRRLSAISDAVDVTHIIHEMAKVIERHGLGQEVIEELLAVVEGAQAPALAGTATEE